MSFNRESPLARKSVTQFAIHDEVNYENSSVKATGGKVSTGPKTNVTTAQESAPMPLSTSANLNRGQQSPQVTHSKPTNVRAVYKKPSRMFDIGHELKQNQSKENLVEQKRDGYPSMDDLLARMSTLEASDRNHPGLASKEVNDKTEFDSVSNMNINHGHQPADPDLLQLKQELQDAKSKIAEMDQELSQQRMAKRSGEQLQSTAATPFLQLTPAPVYQLAHGYAVAHRNVSSTQGEDTTSDKSDGTASQILERPQLGLWGNDPRSANAQFGNGTWNQQPKNSSAWNSSAVQGIGAPVYGGNPSAPQPQRPISFRMDNFDYGPDFWQGATNAPYDPGYCPTRGPPSRGPLAVGHLVGNCNNYPPSAASTPGFSPPATPMPFNPMNAMTHGNMNYQQRPIGTPLSPTAIEFNSGNMMNNLGMQGNPWNAQPCIESGSSYVTAIEPTNYRRMLDRNTPCDWKHLVEKVVCSNDQQASIFMQQKLKVSNGDQKTELIDAIVAQCYPLMINRFGNFLVQRCFEHGTPEQVIAIANNIRGNTLTLSMDPFGCHVVQKAFDAVPEDYKAIMVHELLRRIPETVVHRYACHVWQKLFELRWSDSPPQIMKYVNEALRGMWHEVALGETGSLVVQNIFENCLEEDKRLCINEVLANLDVIAHGQFGNWCVQHICEHGSPADKSRAIEHVLRFANEYSTDQYASKVVEKCLKVAGPDFFDRYLEKICEGRPDRPRMPLIDISSDQYGNYLIQYILMNAGPHHRELVTSHVRKHMVSLRGSKFGSRVAMLCSNPAFQTHAGPPMGMQMNYRYPPKMGMGRAPMHMNMNAGMGMGMGMGGMPMNSGMPYR